MNIDTRVRTIRCSAGSRVRLLALTASLVALVFSSAPATADGDIPQPPPQPLTAAEAVRSQIKSEVAQTYANFKLAGGTPAARTVTASRTPASSRR